MKMKIIVILIMMITPFSTAFAQERQTVKAIYLPLADHYAGIIAYEKYRDQMQEAEFVLERMESLPELRAYFMSGEVDMAFILSPLAMDMFLEAPVFRWISLMHRDGNALAINDLLNVHVNLPENRADRKPDYKIANAFTLVKSQMGKPSECGVPSLLATHTVILYKYLKDHGKTLGFGQGTEQDVVAVVVAPPKSPGFIKKNNARGIPASFEQSLPWADVVETNDFGSVGWYSKDVLVWPNGHVECIVIATDTSIKTKAKALKEVIYYIHKAGLDIEAARQKGQNNLKAISHMIRKHIPEHNEQAIIESLNADLNVINYKHLNTDKGGLKLIMDLGVEGGILKGPIDIDAFADDSFATHITEE
ncbi:MAG: ABC transporter substrate-binding protein [Proteobacteria bacterium]|nr:nitrate ABC transporter substrate-binding protein [Desulfobacula sp.]MBU3953873.1 ABC transporter substrate-binding protein [Pseudomonadota bacterium]MBU4131202.1 ABC transporter substrate-binding protein [Pseudomonadota bacterium]